MILLRQGYGGEVGVEGSGEGAWGGSGDGSFEGGSWLQAVPSRCRVPGAAGGGLGEGLDLGGGVIRVFRFHRTPAIAFRILNNYKIKRLWQADSQGDFGRRRLASPSPGNPSGPRGRAGCFRRRRFKPALSGDRASKDPRPARAVARGANKRAWAHRSRPESSPSGRSRR